MTNKTLIKQEIKKSTSCKLGCYNPSIEKLSKEELTKVLSKIEFCDTTDIDVVIGNKEYVVEMAVVDDEIDLMMLTKQEYIDRYSNERYKDED